MIFAAFEEKPNLKELRSILEDKFGFVEWGDQGTTEEPDAYFWVLQEGVRVSIDNLSSAEFQVKCSNRDSKILSDVIDAVSGKYKLKIYDEPELERHEDENT